MAKQVIKHVDKFYEFVSSDRVVRERKGGGTVGVEIVVKDELGNNFSIALDYHDFIVMFHNIEHYVIDI